MFYLFPFLFFRPLKNFVQYTSIFILTIILQILLLGLTMMASAQLNRFTTPQPAQYYNPQYYGRPYYAILRQSQDSSPDGSYSYRWDRPSVFHPKAFVHFVERTISTRSKNLGCPRGIHEKRSRHSVDVIAKLTRSVWLPVFFIIFIEQWLCD